MSMTEVVEESLKADARFRHLTVMPIDREEECECCDGTGDVHSFDGEWCGECHECNYWRDKK